MPPRYRLGSPDDMLSSDQSVRDWCE